VAVVIQYAQQEKAAAAYLFRRLVLLAAFPLLAACRCAGCYKVPVKCATIYLLKLLCWLLPCPKHRYTVIEAQRARPHHTDSRLAIHGPWGSRMAMHGGTKSQLVPQACLSSPAAARGCTHKMVLLAEERGPQEYNNATNNTIGTHRNCPTISQVNCQHKGVPRPFDQALMHRMLYIWQGFQHMLHLCCCDWVASSCLHRRPPCRSQNMLRHRINPVPYSTSQQRPYLHRMHQQHSRRSFFGSPLGLLHHPEHNQRHEKTRCGAGTQHGSPEIETRANQVGAPHASYRRLLPQTEHVTKQNVLSGDVYRC